jgi:hypothetical protein
MLDKAIDDLNLIYERIDSEGEWIDVSDISLDSVEFAIGALTALRQLCGRDGDESALIDNLKIMFEYKERYNG